MYEVWPFEFCEEINNSNITALNSITLEYRPFAVFLFVWASVFAASAEDFHDLWDKTGKHRLRKQTAVLFIIEALE